MLISNRFVHIFSSHYYQFGAIIWQINDKLLNFCVKNLYGIKHRDTLFFTTKHKGKFKWEIYSAWVDEKLETLPLTYFKVLSVLSTLGIFRLFFNRTLVNLPVTLNDTLRRRKKNVPK